MSDPLIAPNEQAEVQATIDAHPEIDTMDEEARGEIIDITARRLNPRGGEKPWGRKARSNNPSNPNLNTDGMTFLRPDGRFEIYDCISGTDGQSTWDPYGPFAQGENGYWWPPNPVDDTGGGGGFAEAAAALVARVEQLEIAFGDLQTKYVELEERISGVEAAVHQPMHGRGFINVPVVADGLSLRAAGDIDVAVTPGEPEPAPPLGEPPTPLELALLRKLLGRLRPE